jgi:flagellar biosynthesis/type III secretory pathway chaperone
LNSPLPNLKPLTPAETDFFLERLTLFNHALEAFLTILELERQYIAQHQDEKLDKLLEEKTILLKSVQQHERLCLKEGLKLIQSETKHKSTFKLNWQGLSKIVIELAPASHKNKLKLAFKHNLQWLNKNKQACLINFQLLEYLKDTQQHLIHILKGNDSSWNKLVYNASGKWVATPNTKQAVAHV